MSEITDTSRHMTFVYGSTPPKDILRAEARGQKELVASTKLPTDGSESPEVQALGIVFGEVDPADPLFREAALPAGWKLVEDKHSMWSHVEDDRGVRRASVFYKAAPYDRRAHMDAVPVANGVAMQVESGGGIPWDCLTPQEQVDVLTNLTLRKARAESYLQRYPDPATSATLRHITDVLTEHQQKVDLVATIRVGDDDPRSLALCWSPDGWVWLDTGGTRDERVPVQVTPGAAVEALRQTYPNAELPSGVEACRG